MHQDGKAEIRWHPIGNVLPVLAPVVGAINPPMILEEDSLGTGWMHRDGVNTLAKVRKFFRREYHTHASVARLPGLPAVFGFVDAPNRNPDVHPVMVRSVRKYRVQHHPAVAGNPARTMGVIEKAA